jgi:hypothetical protein
MTGGTAAGVAGGLAITSKAVVATPAPAANCRNRRLLVRSFFTLEASSWGCSNPAQTKITENRSGQKGTLRVAFYFTYTYCCLIVHVAMLVCA